MPAVSSTSIAGNGRWPGQSVPGFNEFYQKKGKKSNPSRQAHANNGTSPSSHILTKHLHHLAGGVKLHLNWALPSQRHLLPVLSAFLTQPSCLQSQHWLQHLLLASPAPLRPSPRGPCTPHLRLCPSGQVSPHSELLRASGLPLCSPAPAGAGHKLPALPCPPSTWALLGRPR